VGTLSGLAVQGLLIASNGSGISNLNSSNIVGILASSQIYGNTLSNINASNLAFGVVNSSLIYGNTLSNINASNISGLTNVSGNTLSNINASNLAFGVVNSSLIYGNTLSNINASNITQPFANLVVSNTVTTTNINSINSNITSNLSVSGALISNATNTTLFFDTLTIPYINTLTMNSAAVTTGTVVATAPSSFANLIVANLQVTNTFIITATNTQTTNSLSVINQGTTTALYVNQNEFPNMTYNVAEFWDHTQIAMIIDGYGNVAIHTASSPGYAFTVVNGAKIDNLMVTGILNASGAALSSLNASNVTTGIISSSRIYGNTLSNINSANITQPFTNLVVSNSVTTTNIFVTGKLQGPNTSLANLFVANSVTTTNIFTTGNVGIGTSTPGAMFDVVTTATPGAGALIAQFGTSASARLQFYDENGSLPPYIYGAAGNGLGFSSSGDIKFYPNANPGTPTMTVNQNVGLTVNGNIYAFNSLTTTNIFASNVTTNILTVAEYQNILLPNTSWKSIAFGFGAFVAVNSGRTASYSLDYGQTWSSSTLPDTEANWNYVFYSPSNTFGTFIALGGNAQIGISYDRGATWLDFSVNYSQYWTSGCVASNGNFVIVGGTGHTANWVGDPEAVWASSNLPNDQLWNSVAAGESNYCIAVGYGDIGAVSADGGQNWSITDLPFSVTWISICYGNGYFVAVSQGNKSIRTNNNGGAWSSAFLPADANWNSVCFGNGIFVAVGDPHIAAWSNDNGSSWNTSILPYGTWGSVSYGDGIFVAVSGYTNFVAISSDNGLTWISYSNTPPPDTLCGPTKTALVDISRTDSTTTGYYALQVSDNTNSIVDVHDRPSPVAMTVLTRDEWSTGSPPARYHLEFANRTTDSGYGERFNYGVGFGFLPDTELYGHQPFLITPHTNQNDGSGFAGPNDLADLPAFSLSTSGNGWVGVAGVTNPAYALDVNGDINASGAIYAASKPFIIPHPFLPVPNKLIHNAIEGPRCDIIYRGRSQLVNGQSNVNIDTDSTTHPMTQGTFVALCTNPQYFLQNDDSFDRVKGKINGNILTITCENSNSNDEVNWMIISERHDESIKSWNKTDSNGFLIPEHSK
jgi:hypothetical protein